MTNQIPFRPASASASASAPVNDEFEAYCLKRATAELAKDLTEIREAPDFTEDSLPILIEALRQSADIFSPEQKQRILTGTKGDKKKQKD